MVDDSLGCCLYEPQGHGLITGIIQRITIHCYLIHKTINAVSLVVLRIFLFYVFPELYVVIVAIFTKSTPNPIRVK